MEKNPRYLPFVRGIRRSPVNSPHKGQWRGALMSSLICARISGWINNREAGDLRRHRTHCDVTVMLVIRDSKVNMKAQLYWIFATGGSFTKSPMMRKTLPCDIRHYGFAIPPPFNCSPAVIRFPMTIRHLMGCLWLPGNRLADPKIVTAKMLSLHAVKFYETSYILKNALNSSKSFSIYNKMDTILRALFFKWIFLNENVFILIQILLQFVPVVQLSIPHLIWLPVNTGQQTGRLYSWYIKCDNENNTEVEWRIYASANLVTIGSGYGLTPNAKPLPGPILTYFWLCHKEYISMKFYS